MGHVADVVWRDKDYRRLGQVGQDLAEKAFEWTGRREQAALLVAQDELSNEEIAAACGVKRQTLDFWKTFPQFKERVAEHVRAIREAVLTQGIANKVKRVKAMDDRWNKLKRIADERGAAAAMRSVSGGTTGYIVRQVKFDKFGGQIDEYAVDTGLLSELRALEKQAAQEVGDWVERKEHAGPGGGPIPVAQVDLTNATDDDLENLDTILSRLAKPGRGEGREGAPSSE